MTVAARTLALAMALLASAAAAQQRYIDIAIPLRSEPNYSSRVLKNGIRSGLEVLLMETSGNWSRVQVDGVEGWMPSQFLNAAQQQTHPRVAQAETILARIRNELAGCMAEVDAQDSARLGMASMQQELQRVQGLAASQIQLDEQNTKLYKATQQLQNDLDIAMAENSALRKREWRDWFIYGAFTTAIGMVIGIIAARLLGGRKRRSAWID